MAYSKRFPKDRKGSPFAQWEEIELSPEEELSVEEAQRKRNIELMRESINDAKKVFFEEKLKDFQSDLIRIAVALFNQRSSHLVYWKEDKAKEKFKKTQ